MHIAERVLKLRRSHQTVDVVVRLFAPEQRDGAWRCRYEIGWPDRLKAMASGGADSVQALLLALQMIGTELYTSGYHQAGELGFDGPGSGYGFLVPRNLRDLLVGDDAKEFGDGQGA